ncbi:MAG: hypothetical protein HWQ44_19980 [Nostoc sp. JL34]|uniref:hypothetical protein n=1 Tax=Nostoc sp. JL34 TaxID=2815397 RepID=UPI001E007353|nr:hypothetical protein [Nostoc sp. JL34]MBN3885154.1 hypothetical protein [Nostoc sp. JL34]
MTNDNEQIAYISTKRLSQLDSEDMEALKDTIIIEVPTSPDELDDSEYEEWIKEHAYDWENK